MHPCTSCNLSRFVEKTGEVHEEEVEVDEGCCHREQSWWGGDFHAAVAVRRRITHGGGRPEVEGEERPTKKARRRSRKKENPKSCVEKEARRRPDPKRLLVGVKGGTWRRSTLRQGEIATSLEEELLSMRRGATGRRIVAGEEAAKYELPWRESLRRRGQAWVLSARRRKELRLPCGGGARR